MIRQDFELRLKMSECQIRYGLHDAVVRMNVISGAAAPRLKFRLMQQADEAVRSARKQSFCLEMISALNPTCFHLIPTSIEPCVHHDCRCLLFFIFPLSTLHLCSPKPSLSLDCSLSACMKGVLDHCVVLSISRNTCKLLEVPNQSMSEVSYAPIRGSWLALGQWHRFCNFVSLHHLSEFLHQIIKMRLKYRLRV